MIFDIALCANMIKYSLMPRHREGPVKNAQTGYYFFDSYVDIGPERRRVRFSLNNTSPIQEKGRP